MTRWKQLLSPVWRRCESPKTISNWHEDATSHAITQHHSKFLSILFILLNFTFRKQGLKPVSFSFTKCLICLISASSIIRFSSTCSYTWPYFTSSSLYDPVLFQTHRDIESEELRNPQHMCDALRRERLDSTTATYICTYMWTKQMFTQQKTRSTRKFIRCQ